MRALAGYRDVLAIRDARALIGASAASQIGDWLYNAALLGYVFSATHSAAWVGAATICRLLPYVLLGPFGGAVADRYLVARCCWPETCCVWRSCSSWRRWSPRTAPWPW